MLVKQKQIKQKILSNYTKNLSDEQKFKLWIKTILSVQNNLPEIIKSIDKIIEIKASSLSFISDIYNTEKSTQAQVERVIDLTERKNKLLNLYLISKKLVDSLNEDDKLYLQRKYIFSWTAEELSQEYQISIRTAFRRTEKLIDQIYEKLKKSNWSLNFITNQINGEVWLIEKFNRYAKDSMPNKFSIEQNLNSFEK